MGSEIRSLTGVRGLAAFWVMVGHYLGDSPANEDVRFFVSHSYFAVDVFMVLSGFVLALTYEARFQPALALAPFRLFLWHRLARIWPLYALTTVICAAMAWWDLPIWGRRDPSFGIVTANLLMAQSWAPDFSSLNATGWSISTEWAANLLFPVFVLTLMRWPLHRAALVAGVAVLVLTRSAFLDGNAGEGDSAAGALDWYTFPQSLVRCTAEFMLGMFCWRLREKVRWTAFLGHTPVLLALLAVSAVLTMTWWDIALVPLTCCLVIGLSFERSWLAAALGSGLPRWLGTISFGIYLWQLPVLVFRPGTEAVLTRLGVPFADDTATWMLMAAVLGVSALSFRWFERPVQRWMRGMAGRPASGTAAPVTRRAATMLMAGALLAEADAAEPPAEASTERWWRRRHTAKRVEARRGPVDLVLLGDSITHNYEATGPESWHDFRQVWARFYGDRSVLNLGFSGDTTARLLWRLRNGEIDGIDPKAVVILIGTNDLGWGRTAEETVAGIAAVVDEVRRRLPKAGVVLIGILPSQSDVHDPRQVNAVLASRYGDGANISYIDVASVFERNGVLDTSLFYDPNFIPPEPALHPSPEGQARMAEAIEPLVARLLGDRVHTR